MSVIASPNTLDNFWSALWNEPTNVGTVSNASANQAADVAIGQTASQVENDAAAGATTVEQAVQNVAQTASEAVNTVTGGVGKVWQGLTGTLQELPMLVPLILIVVLGIGALYFFGKPGSVK